MHKFLCTSNVVGVHAICEGLRSTTLLHIVPLMDTDCNVETDLR